jgi:uncharacterized repeat protein (TIGR01451 family)
MISTCACGGRATPRPAANRGDGGRSSADSSTRGATVDQMRQARQATFGTDVALAMRGPARVTVGGSVELVMTVSNRGPGTAQQVEVNLELPAGLTFRSSSANCQEYRPPGGIACTLPTIGRDRSFQLTLRANLASRPGDDTLLVRASLTSGPAGVVDPNPTNNASSVRITVVAPTSR